MVSHDANQGHGNSYEISAGRQSADGSSLLDVLGLIRRRKWLVAFGLIVGLGLASLYYYVAPRSYESTVEILVMPKDSNISTQDGPGSNDFQSQSAGEDILATHMLMFRSPAVAKAALEGIAGDQEDESPETAPLKEREWKAEWKKLAKASQEASGFSPDWHPWGIIEAMESEDGDPVKYIRDNLSVGRGGEGKAKKASILSAAFRSPNPDESAAILQAVVASYQTFLVGTFEKTGNEALKVIGTAREEIATELKKKEDEYIAFRKTATITGRGENRLNLHQERQAKAEEALAELEVKYSETTARIAVIERAMKDTDEVSFSDLDKLALLSGTDTARLEFLLKATGKDDYYRFRAENPEIEQSANTEYQRLLTMLIEEATLLEDFGPDHPEVLATREKISLIKKFLKDNEVSSEDTEADRLDPTELLTAHLGLLKHDRDEMEQRETDLETIAAEQGLAAKELTAEEVEDTMLNGELTRLRDLYNAVLAKVRDINLITEYGGFLTEVISPVETAKDHRSPVLIITLGMGGIFGMVLGCSLALLVDTTDRTFRDPDELQQVLDVPVMAHIPGLGVRRRKSSVITDDEDRPVIDPSVVVAHRPKSWQSEAFRGLRTAVHFSAQGSKCRVIQVTSANPKDGKTTVTTNLAVSFAQSGKRVLLVDCDFRRPRVGQVFGIKSEIGLAEVIMGEAEPLDTIIPSEIENLWILPCGHSPSNPSELLTSPEFERFVGVMRDRYDLVVIDSPPMLAVSDPAVIAPRVDGVLMTVKITKHGRPGVMHAKEILSRVGANILGIVVNGSEQGKGYGYGYGGTYGKKKGYGYGYGYGGGYGGGYGSGYGYGGDENPYHDEEEETTLAR